MTFRPTSTNPDNVVASRLTFGATLNKDSAQTVLPIILRPSGQIVGVYLIARTVFTGSPETFTMPQGEIPVTTVTLPAKPQGNQVNWTNNAPVMQYVAAVWEDGQQVTERPWLGYGPLFNNGETGYYHYWTMPTGGWQERFGEGFLIGPLVRGLDIAVGIPSPQPPVVDNPNLEMRWAATVNLDSLSDDCPFFDFNWVTQFAAQLPVQEGSMNIVPLRIEVLTNPPEGYFKAMVVTGQQTFVNGGATMFEAMRILALEEPTAGDYEFTFRIYTQENLTADVTLTLTVV